MNKENAGAPTPNKYIEPIILLVCKILKGSGKGCHD